MSNENKFAQHCIVEIYGHTKLAGLVTEASIGGVALVRIDALKGDGSTLFTRYYGSGAIFSISPVSKEVCLMAADNINMPAPVSEYELRKRPKQITANIDSEDVLEDESEEEISEQDRDGYTGGWNE